ARPAGLTCPGALPGRPVPPGPSASPGPPGLPGPPGPASQSGRGAPGGWSSASTGTDHHTQPPPAAERKHHGAVLPVPPLPVGTSREVELIRPWYVLSAAPAACSDLGAGHVAHEEAQMSDFRPGLEGVVAFETQIAEPDREGGSLRYRGVDIED